MSKPTPKTISTYDVPSVAAKLAEIRGQGQTIVQCHGVFDLLHPGHVSHLAEAKAQGDILVVTITPDRFVNKGPGRPVFTQEHRALMLAALEVVDFVAITDDPTAVERWANLAIEIRLPAGERRRVPRPPHPLCGCRWPDAGRAAS